VQASALRAGSNAIAAPHAGQGKARPVGVWVGVATAGISGMPSV
jgi:hypothetical protein